MEGNHVEKRGREKTAFGLSEEKTSEERETESQGREWVKEREIERLSQTSMAALCKWLTSPDVKLNRETLMSCVYLKSPGPTPQDCERQIP